MTRHFGWPEFLFILSALRWTIALSLIAFFGGGILGVIVAALRTAPSRIAQWSMIAFIELFQGTPVLMQLFVAYYGLSVLLDVNIDPWPAVTIALICTPPPSSAKSGAAASKPSPSANGKPPKPSASAASPRCASLSSPRRCASPCPQPSGSWYN